LTMVASRLPWLSSRNIAAREDADSAVSLAEKNADTTRQMTTARIVNQSIVLMVLRSSSGLSRWLLAFGFWLLALASTLRKLLAEECAHRAGVDAALDESGADPFDQDECKPSALHFLVLRDQLHQLVNGW
jgi:hypothetical protein